jgi:hypothetical protein
VHSTYVGQKSTRHTDYFMVGLGGAPFPAEGARPPRCHVLKQSPDLEPSAPRSFGEETKNELFEAYTLHEIQQSDCHSSKHLQISPESPFTKAPPWRTTEEKSSTCATLNQPQLQLESSANHPTA